MIRLTLKPPFQISPGTPQSADGAISVQHRSFYAFVSNSSMKCNILVSSIFHLTQSSTTRVLCTFFFCLNVTLFDLLRVWTQFKKSLASARRCARACWVGGKSRVLSLPVAALIPVLFQLFHVSFRGSPWFAARERSELALPTHQLFQGFP